MGGKPGFAEKSYKLHLAIKVDLSNGASGKAHERALGMSRSYRRGL